MNTPLPTGYDSDTKTSFSFGGPGNVPLPGEQKAEVPALPGSEPVTTKPEVPTFWAEPVRVIRDIIDLAEKSPAEADRIAKFAREKLAALTAAK